MSAIEYDFMSSLINNKKQEIEQKNEIKGIPPLPSVSAFSGSNNMFALGGDYQTNGSDFTTGMTHIDAGGSHEENPNEGVQMGVDREGTPNLVEEGETVFNDYVYSNRIELDDKAKEAFHVSKKQKIAYSDFSKKLEKESVERPNDPISQAGLKAQLEDLAEHQERQKQEMEEKRAQEAFDALTPEEQAGLMQYAQEQQVAQEQAAQEQMMQQMSPEEQAMMQQQMADGSTPNLGAGSQMSAYGGKVNRFDRGGELLKKRIYEALGLYTDEDFNNWAQEYGIGEIEDWSKALNNQALIDALGTVDDTLPHAMSMGYDYGMFVPTESPSEINFKDSEGNSYMNTGNWQGANNRLHPSATWNNSGDRMYKEAVEALQKKHGNNWKNVWDKLTRPELETLFKETQAYKDTSEWLQKSSDNMRSYLRALSADPEFKTPSAVAHLEKFLDRKTGDWKQGVDTSDIAKLYSQIFGVDSGNAGRLFYPGNYWHTPNILNNPRGNKIRNYVMSEDGDWKEVVTDVPKDWELGRSLSWQDAESDYTNNYYYNPAVKDPFEELDVDDAGNVVPVERDEKGNIVPTDPKGKWDVSPNYKNEGLRYAGLFGPAVGLGMQALGLGKPDTSRLDAAIKQANDVAFAKPYLIGDYMKYNPLDRLFYSNQLQANSRATDRGIMNTSGGNRGAAMAGLIANGYNTNNSLGNLYRQAEEYNRGQYERTKEFNRGTNQFNAQTLTQNSQFNADAYNRNRQFTAQLGLNAAAQKMDADAGWWNGIYGNIGGLFKGIGDLGRENAQHNMIAEMAADGLFGTLSPRTNTGRRGKYLTFTERKAKGGKINRKKGGK